MNSLIRLASHCGFIVLVFLLGAGCATNKIDWSTRVGVYTYDQVVLEMGPPDRYAKLEDNTLVADWMIARGHFQTGPVVWGNPNGFGPTAYSSYYSTMPDFYLRLTFGPDKKLQSWKKFAR
ncbi:MAG TPA: hypothetical protein VH255_06065 [Verrucomicrobiae bacterium]|jgi:hypothetical protein|nr:hypothetical protein [Verrucomicrobiae bacterium]